MLKRIFGFVYVKKWVKNMFWLSIKQESKT